MAKHTTLTDLFTGIADALRRKTGGTGSIVADDFPTVIDSLSTGGITPTGTKTITSNGTHDVTAYASAQVNVPSSGITPTGTKTITTNGTHDVTNYANAQVAVPTPAEKVVVRTVSIASDVTGANNTYTLLSGDDFVKAHYADTGFSAMLIAQNPVASEANVVHFNYLGNRNIGSTNAAKYGFGYRSTNTTTVGMIQMTAKINGKGYTQHLRVDSSGNLLQYLATGYILKAGTYQIVLTCTTE